MKDIIACISAGIEATRDAEEIDARVELMEELTDRVSGVTTARICTRWEPGAPRAVRGTSPHARLRAATAECSARRYRTTRRRRKPRLDATRWVRCCAWPLARDDAPPTDAAEAESTTTAEGDASKGTKELQGSRQGSVRALVPPPRMRQGGRRSARRRLRAAEELPTGGPQQAEDKSAAWRDTWRRSAGFIGVVDAGHVLAAAASLAGSSARARQTRRGNGPFGCVHGGGHRDGSGWGPAV